MENKMTVYTNKAKQPIAIIYKQDEKYIAVEKYSSIGFKTSQDALKWLGFVCKPGNVLNIDDNILKLILQPLRNEVIKEINDLNKITFHE